MAKLLIFHRLEDYPQPSMFGYGPESEMLVQLAPFVSKKRKKKLWPRGYKTFSMLNSAQLS